MRRDQCPATATMLARVLRLLFQRRDLSAVRVYLERQWQKIIAQRVSLRDLIFAKEVKLGAYRGPTLPAAAMVASRAAADDPRAAPLWKERIQYVVVEGEGTRLYELVHTPEEVMQRRLRINAEYYITRAINPALARVLNLVGVDVEVRARVRAELMKLREVTRRPLLVLHRADMVQSDATSARASPGWCVAPHVTARSR